MALGFTLEVGDYKWTAESESVFSIDFDSTRSPKAVTMVDVRIWDRAKDGKYFPIFNSLPDPAFTNVPFKLYLQAADQTKPQLVFDGKVGALQPGYPGPSHTSIVAYDHSISARIQSRYKTYANLKSTDIAKQIARDYGFQSDLSLTQGLSIPQRAVDIGMGGMGHGALSDWDHLTRALSADGLELYVTGNKMTVRRNANQVYATAFSPDDGNVISFEARINHVSGPGEGGQSRTPAPGGTKGTVNSATGSAAQEADKEGSQALTHRHPIAGSAKGHDGAHTESLPSLTEPASKRRDRKDEVTLTTRLLPDIAIHHKIKLSGWGKKVDGTWHLTRLHHSFFSASNASTTMHLSNAPLTDGTSSKGNATPGGTRQ